MPGAGAVRGRPGPRAMSPPAGPSPSRETAPAVSGAPPRYCQVAFNLPLSQTFTYAIPETLRGALQPGMRVNVPFGAGRRTGYVVGLSLECDPGLKLKSVRDVPDAAPLLSEELLELTRWAAEYYQAGWGEVIRAALPAGLEEEPPEVFQLTGAGEEALESASLPKAQRRLLEAVARKGRRTARQLRRELGRGYQAQTLHLLREKGWLEARLPGARSSAQFRRRRVAALRPHLDPAEVETRLKAAPKQKKLFELIREKERSLEDLRRLMPGYAPLLRALKQKGLVETRSEKQEREGGGTAPVREEADTAPTLNPEQQAAFGRLEQALEARAFHTFLLQGVTGSGKTEIYLRLIEQVLRQGRTAIMLVPEISLTPQTAHRFRARFGGRVAILHSGLSPIERYVEWRRIREGRVSIAVGARSAVFAPFRNLGALIIDEEHDVSYKQDTVPRYHARDLAIVRGRMNGAVVVLGSATPALETRYNAERGKYTLLKLTERVGRRLLPLVTLVDMRTERAQAKNFSILSRALQRAVRHRLDHQEQVFLFLNRRGTANYVVCKTCGFVFDCPHCSVSLTFHGSARRMLCHYCNFHMTQPAHCPECQGEVMRFSGFGTQKLEEETRRLFPGARLARLDRDTARHRNAFETMFQRMKAGEIDILIGTQMITKGHDFPGVTLVGVVYADLSLHIPDFRSAERTFQLLTQVAGRAGRGHVPGEVIVQAHQLEHEVYGFVRRHDYCGFYTHELEQRRRLHFPPFARLAVVEVEGEAESATEQACRNLAACVRGALAAHPAVELLGPSRAALYRLQDRFRWHFVLRAEEAGDLGTLLHALRQSKTWHRLTAGPVKVTLDVDPMNML